MEGGNEDFDEEEADGKNCEANVVCSIRALDWLVIPRWCICVRTCQKRWIALPTLCCWLIA